jgi:hypothetical protein
VSDICLVPLALCGAERNPALLVDAAAILCMYPNSLSSLVIFQLMRQRTRPKQNMMSPNRMKRGPAIRVSVLTA